MTAAEKPKKKAPVKKAATRVEAPAPVQHGEILDIDEAADYLRVSRTTVYKLAAARKIPAFKLQGMWRFRLQSLR
jgi:excisionase family DNA binding protein